MKHYAYKSKNIMASNIMKNCGVLFACIMLHTKEFHCLHDKPLTLSHKKVYHKYHNSVDHSATTQIVICYQSVKFIQQKELLQCMCNAYLKQHGYYPPKMCLKLCVCQVNHTTLSRNLKRLSSAPIM